MTHVSHSVLLTVMLAVEVARRQAVEVVKVARQQAVKVVRRQTHKQEVKVVRSKVVKGVEICFANALMTILSQKMKMEQLKLKLMALYKIILETMVKEHVQLGMKVLLLTVMEMILPPFVD